MEQHLANGALQERHVAEGAIITRVFASLLGVDAQAWNSLLACQSQPTPFMRHEYLTALERSGSATPDTGWTRTLSRCGRAGR